MNYDNLCRSILQMNSKVRFAGICDVSGEIKHGGQKEGVKNIQLVKKQGNQIYKL